MHISAKNAFLALILTSCVAGQANAADLPSLTVPYPEAQATIVPVADPLPWQGFHVGVLGSYSKYKADIATPVGSQSPLSNGAMIGGLAGVDVQMGSLVLGAEADTSFGTVTGANAAASSEIRQFSTFRGRAGIAAGDLLFYGTGGLAAADMTVKSRFHGDDNKVVWGWTYGGGVEAKITENITVRGEYLYTRLDKTDFNLNPSRTTSRAGAEDFHTFRAAVSYQLPIL